MHNDTYGRDWMYLALQQKQQVGEINISIPSEGTVRKVIEQIKLIHKPRREPNGITKADREARKAEDLLKRDFYADNPLEKTITDDITGLKAKNGKLYVCTIFDCFDLMRLGLSMVDHMRASLCCQTVENAKKSYP